jgi:hypothetical protein
MYLLLSGAMMMNCWVISFFFLRFWRKTRDRLLIFFSIAFFLMGAERLALGIFFDPEESSPRIYLLRLLTFLLIIIGIIDKNRNHERQSEKN